MLEDMQRREVIEESDSPWPSPIHQKIAQDLRSCVDYRKLNTVTRKDCLPLPQVDDTLDTLTGAKWFFSMDLKGCYWQVALHTDDKEETAISTVQGLWQFTVMSFGLCNALAMFEWLMETVLRGLMSHVLCTWTM
jgi:hypothetical protein